MLTDAKRVLLFAAHADDEIVGPGGTLRRLSDAGAEVTVVTMTRGDTGYPSPEMKDKIVEMRKKESEAAAKCLGIKNWEYLGRPCQNLTNDVETFRDCVRLIRKYRPEVILTHAPEDKHRDHRAASQIADEARWKATEPIMHDYGEPWYTQYLFYYETTELFAHPTVVVDITDQLDAKRRAMLSQESQLDVIPGVVKWIEGTGMARGMLCGTRYAEAFQISNFLPARL